MYSFFKRVFTVAIFLAKSFRLICFTLLIFSYFENFNKRLKSKNLIEFCIVVVLNACDTAGVHLLDVFFQNIIFFLKWLIITPFIFDNLFIRINECSLAIGALFPTISLIK